VRVEADVLVADVLVAAGCELGEGPVWSVAEQRLYWVDILGARVHSCTANGGDRRDFGTDRHVGCVALRAGGGLLLAARDRFEWRDATGQLTRTVDLPQRDPELRFNDGACDPAGRFLAGTMAYRVRRGAGTVYRLDPAGAVTPLLPGVSISNGLAWSADGRTLYYVDSPLRADDPGTAPPGAVDAFDYDPDTGALSHRRTAVTIPYREGTPDGLTVDADGCLWVALNRGGAAVRRYAPTGELLATVSVPVPQVTSCAFGGSALDTLYITTARENMDVATMARYPLSGSLFAVRPGVTGVPEHLYAG
jgi:sugar lactone lactonase YvrE